MSSKKIYSNQEILIHISIWTMYVVFNYFVSYVQMNTWPYVSDTLTKYMIAVLIFYPTANFIFPRYFKLRKYWIGIILLIALCFITFIIKELICRKVYPLLGIKMPYAILPFFFMHTWWWFQYTLMGVGYWYAKDSIAQQKILRQTELLHLQYEREKLALENAHLRAQINPHFLFNTLGYFHNKILNLDPELAEGVVALSDIMRSAIREPDQQGMVLLEDEVASIENLVRIYQMRYSNGVYINLDIQVRYTSLKILPHILITLVENAMKHGELHDPQHPLTITMCSGIDDLYFRIHNKKQTGPKELSHGIGIRYIRSQLSYVYKNRYSMDIADEQEHYTVILVIDGFSR